MTPEQFNSRPINKLAKGDSVVLKDGKKHVVERVEGGIFSQKIVLFCWKKIDADDVAEYIFKEKK
jgi:hypothetical protein